MDKTVTTTIDAVRCNGCGLCVAVCPSNTISMQGRKAAVTGSESLHCGHCAAVCPTGAVRVAALDPAFSDFKTFQARKSWLPHGSGDIRDLLQVMQSRRSCRNFHTEKAVSKELLEDLVRIGISAPSGTNCQLWTFTLLPHREAVLRLGRVVGDFFKRTNRAARKGWLRKALQLIGRPELERYYQEHYQRVRDGLEKWEEEGVDLLFHGAPAAIVVGSGRQASCPVEDALLASQNILLGAHVLGLGTCLIGFVVEAARRDRTIRREIGMDDGEQIYAVIALGYPDEKYSHVAGRKRALIRCCAD